MVYTGQGISHTSNSRSLTQECYNYRSFCKFKVPDWGIKSTLAQG
jgi:hypothetical protein